MSLKDDGFRFVIRGGSADWVHPSLVQSGDVDATDMPDEEFECALAKGRESAAQCQYAHDVGMLEYRCASKCQYATQPEVRPADDEWLSYPAEG